MRMPVFVAAIYVGPAVVVEIAARTLNAIVEALPLHISEFGWRRIPPPVVSIVVPVMVSIL